MVVVVDRFMTFGGGWLFVVFFWAFFCFFACFCYGCCRGFFVCVASRLSCVLVWFFVLVVVLGFVWL
jgi:hypothetical protein